MECRKFQRLPCVQRAFEKSSDQDDPMMPRHAASQSGNSSSREIPSLVTVRQKVLEVFKKRPCLWQYRVPEAIWQGKHALLSVGTGQGKTLAFQIPALFAAAGQVQIIITPLNVLATQNVEQLGAIGIPAISINAETATKQNFEVSSATIFLGS